MYNYDSDFGGNFTGIAPRNYTRGTTYRGTTILTKTGGSSDDSYGGNTFYDDLTITNSGTGRMRLGNSVADDHNGNVTYIKSSTGALEPTRSTSSTYAGNISFNTNTAITLGANTGTVIMDGTGAQYINELASSPEPIFRRLTLNNSAGEITLNRPITIRTTMTFTNGNLITTSANLLHVNDEATVSDASDNSYVDGPVEKIGNNAFVFPVGDAGRYRPIAMSAPNSNASRFRARYFEVNPSTLYGWGDSSWELPIKQTSTKEYWTLDGIANVSPVSVTLSWNTNSGGVTDLSSLVVCRHDGSIWKHHGNGGTTGNTTAGTIVSSGTISSFSPFTLGVTNTINNPLPVELTEFKATPNEEENVVDLFWVTSSEINNDYFTIEKTKDLKSFEEVIQVTGQGTTNEKTEYHEKDYNPSAGVSYYRLSQTDFDGTTEYFDLKKVLFDIKHNVNDIHVELYPNPNNGHNMFLKIPNSDSEEINVLVNDFIGKSYLTDFTVINQGNYSVVSIEMNQKLAAGSYMINISVNGENHSHKLIVQ